eukprot:gnl/TRDRNA2_/TRDRNA2_33654_c0_seq1.p1 gnl/TRDRNA2_/TRDRNA2_33654_c0~~gnl/TRDRNA2_/TRDRNA2_33654_c0_seq1.p1  ORF type:complete len:358 (-),score=58.71 gnl/TRDRNA2_/TRDRNA2_33654_c0_seq1:119-1192(-)
MSADKSFQHFPFDTTMDTSPGSTDAMHMSPDSFDAMDVPKGPPPGLEFMAWSDDTYREAPMASYSQMEQMHLMQLIWQKQAQDQQQQQMQRKFPEQPRSLMQAYGGSMHHRAHPNAEPMKIPVQMDEQEWDPCAVQSCPDTNIPQGAPHEEEKTVQASSVMADASKCRWHKSAETVGIVSQDGHVFTKQAGPRRTRFNNRGPELELSSICMVFDSSLRCGGVHQYTYQILGGEICPADGAGFVFDSKVRRNNIQRMRSVFLNQRGRICLRNNQQVTKLQVQLPPLAPHMTLVLLVNLDALVITFRVSDSLGMVDCAADVHLGGLFDFGSLSPQAAGDEIRSGFFCAVVTGDISVGLH